MSWSVSSVRGDGRSACETAGHAEVEEGRGPLAVCRRRSHVDCVLMVSCTEAGHDLEHNRQAPES